MGVKEVDSRFAPFGFNSLVGGPMEMKWVVVMLVPNPQRHRRNLHLIRRHPHPKQAVPLPRQTMIYRFKSSRHTPCAGTGM